MKCPSAGERPELPPGPWRTAAVPTSPPNHPPADQKHHHHRHCHLPASRSGSNDHRLARTLQSSCPAAVATSVSNLEVRHLPAPAAGLPQPDHEALLLLDFLIESVAVAVSKLAIPSEQRQPRLRTDCSPTPTTSLLPPLPLPSLAFSHSRPFPTQASLLVLVSGLHC